MSRRPASGPCCEFFDTEQVEQISTEVLPWPLEREEIYLMEFPADAIGRKPAARSAILEAWNQGALLVNYTGHGSEIVMAHENVFLYDDVSLLHNVDRLPLFYAASCRLNKFDQQTVDSMGELLVKSAAADPSVDREHEGLGGGPELGSESQIPRRRVW